MSVGLFPTVWFCGWAFGEGFAALTVARMVGGAEVLRIVGGDLEVGAERFGFVRRKLYRGADIRDLGACAVPYLGDGRSFSLVIGADNGFGSVKFAYGAGTVYLAAGLNEAEGRLIVDRIRKRLPAAAE